VFSARWKQKENEIAVASTGILRFAVLVIWNHAPHPAARPEKHPRLDRLPELSAKASEAIAHPIARSGEKGYSQKGWASWYGPGLHGNLTASGERFNQYDLTAAHPNLPFGTWVRVTNLNNNRSRSVAQP